MHHEICFGHFFALLRQLSPVITREKCPSETIEVHYLIVFHHLPLNMFRMFIITVCFPFILDKSHHNFYSPYAISKHNMYERSKLCSKSITMLITNSNQEMALLFETYNNHLKNLLVTKECKITHTSIVPIDTNVRNMSCLSLKIYIELKVWCICEVRCEGDFSLL